MQMMPTSATIIAVATARRTMNGAAGILSDEEDEESGNREDRTLVGAQRL